MQKGTIYHLSPDCRLFFPEPGISKSESQEVASHLGLVLLEDEPEPFGGPGVSEPLGRAVESLKVKGRFPLDMAG